MRLFRRLRRLNAGEARLLAEAQYLLVACQFARWRRPVGQLLRIANESADSASGTAQSGDAGTVETAGASSRGVELDKAAMIAWAITRTADYGLFRPKCLVRSLALQRMLRRHLATGGELRLGFRMENGRLEAHAWVELLGRVLGDSPAHVRTFTPATGLRLVEQ
jgi:hypothetical protein